MTERPGARRTRRQTKWSACSASSTTPLSAMDITDADAAIFAPQKRKRRHRAPPAAQLEPPDAGNSALASANVAGSDAAPRRHAGASLTVLVAAKRREQGAGCNATKALPGSSSPQVSDGAAAGDAKQTGTLQRRQRTTIPTFDAADPALSAAADAGQQAHDAQAASSVAQAAPATFAHLRLSEPLQHVCSDLGMRAPTPVQVRRT